jgi:aminopeptidase-like protein
LIRINESNVIPVRETPGEPFLTKYNLRQSIENKRLAGIDAVLSNLIAYSDGKHDLIELSKITGVKITELYYLLNKLVELKILSIK